MGSSILRKGDVGVVVSVTLGEDISDASEVEIVLVGPSGARKVVEAEASSSSAVYITEAGVFDEEGSWVGQVHVVQPEKDRRSSVFLIVVERAL